MKAMISNQIFVFVDNKNCLRVLYFLIAKKKKNKAKRDGRVLAQADCCYDVS